MKSNNILGIIIIGVIVYFVFIGGDKWMGFHYLDQHDSSVYINSPEFDSLEECKEWVKSKISPGRITPLNYACRKNCRLYEPSGEHICESTPYRMYYPS